MATINEKITLGLDMTKSAAQINADIKKLQGQLKQLKTVGTLDAAQTARQINAQISALQEQLKAVRISAIIDTGESGGSALEGQMTQLESLEESARKLGSAFQSLSATVLNSGLKEWLNDFGTDSASILDTVKDKLASWGVTGLEEGIRKFVKNFA